VAENIIVKLTHGSIWIRDKSQTIL